MEALGGDVKYTEEGQMLGGGTAGSRSRRPRKGKVGVEERDCQAL